MSDTPKRWMPDGRVFEGLGQPLFVLSYDYDKLSEKLTAANQCIAKLTEESSQAYIELSFAGVRPNSLREGIAQIIAERDALKKDAERYQWLRSCSVERGSQLSDTFWSDLGNCLDEDFDNSIDTAMQKDKA